LGSNAIARTSVIVIITSIFFVFLFIALFY
jgi:hypothetical protein